MLSASVVVSANTTVTRQIAYGVRVNLNGQDMQFADDMRPFMMDGRTFLPVRAIAEAVDMPVDFDGSTNTVFLGNRNQAVRTSLRQAAPFFDRSPNRNENVYFNDFNSMSGVTYHNTLAFALGSHNGARTNFSLHNLNGQFRTLSGTLGRVDGSSMRNVKVNFIGDGRLLQSYDLNATDMPTPVNVFVEGVQQLRIEVEFPRTQSERIWYALAAYLE
jgi:hypothetical protein